MRAKVQGTAVLDCVVTAEGTVAECQVVRSLDSSFGLDQKAVAAAKQWRFVPGSAKASRCRCWSPSNSRSRCGRDWGLGLGLGEPFHLIP